MLFKLSGIWIVILLVILYFKKKRQVKNVWGEGIFGRVRLNQHLLKCQVCKSDFFEKREAILATSFLSFFNLSCFNQSGSAYVCANCGFIHWFSRPKEISVEFGHAKRTPEEIIEEG